MAYWQLKYRMKVKCNFFRNIRSEYTDTELHQKPGVTQLCVCNVLGTTISVVESFQSECCGSASHCGHIWWLTSAPFQVCWCFVWWWGPRW